MFASQFCHLESVSEFSKVHFCHHLNWSNIAGVTHPKSMCLPRQKAKVQNIGFGSKERFIDREAAKWGS